MEYQSPTSTPPRPLRQHQRTKDLLHIVGLLNVWAIAPTMGDRSKALRDALRAYKKAVSEKHYPSIPEAVCDPTAACYVAPAGSYEALFGSPEENPNALPWED